MPTDLMCRGGHALCAEATRLWAAAQAVRDDPDASARARDAFYRHAPHPLAVVVWTPDPPFGVGPVRSLLWRLRHWLGAIVSG